VGSNLKNFQFSRVGFSFPNGIRTEMMDEELMSLMAAACVHTITVAVETASERLQKKLDKVAVCLGRANKDSNLGVFSLSAFRERHSLRSNKRSVLLARQSSSC
jgi:hypothetical protein